MLSQIILAAAETPDLPSLMNTQMGMVLTATLLIVQFIKDNRYIRQYADKWLPLLPIAIAPLLCYALNPTPWFDFPNPLAYGVLIGMEAIGAFKVVQMPFKKEKESTPQPEEGKEPQ